MLDSMPADSRRRPTIRLAVGSFALFALIAVIWAWSRIPEPSISECSGLEPLVAESSSSKVASTLDRAAVESIRGSELALEAEPRTTADQDPFTLRVLDESRRPLASVPVRYVNEMVWRYPGAGDWFDPAWWDRHGETFRTDANGEVVLPPFEGYGRVSVEWQGRRGDLTLSRPLVGTPTVLVESQSALQVRVVDVRGNSVAGVPLRMQAASQEWSTCGNVLDEPLWSGETAEPITRIGPLESLLEPFLRPRRSRGAHSLPYLLVDVIGGEGPQSFDPHRPPTDLWELRLPPTGQLTVELIGPDGQPVRDGVRVQADSGAGTRFPVRDGAVASSVDGAVTFPFVAVGVPVGVQVTSGGYRGRSEIAPLTHEGEHRVQVLCLEPAPPTGLELRGRLSLAPGASIAQRGFEFLVARSAPRSNRSSDSWNDLTVGDEGEFVLCLSRAREPMELWVRSTDGGAPGSSVAVMEGSVELPDVARTRSSVDVGVLALTARPLLVSGRVTSDTGRPVPNAAVRVSLARSVARTAHAMTDGKGRFHLFADPGLVYERMLSVSAPGHDSERRPSERPGRSFETRFPFRVGQRDVEIILRERASVVGRVLLERGIPPEILDVEVESEAGFVLFRWGTDGQFSLRGPRGECRLVFSLRGRPFTRVEPSRLLIVEHELGHATTVEGGPSPLEIDLRGLLQRTVVEVVDEAHQPIPARVAWVRSGREPEWHDSANGVVTLYTESPAPPWVAIVPENGRYGEVLSKPGALRVVGRPGIVVDLVAEGLPEPPGGWCYTWTSTIPRPGDDRFRYEFRDRADPEIDGATLRRRLHVPASGKLEVSWFLTPNGIAALRRSVRLEWSQEIEVLDLDKPQRGFLTPPTAEIVRHAVESVQ